MQLLSLCGGGGGWGLHSHFHVQPNYSVEVALCCVVVGVVTIIENVSFFDISDKSIILTFQFI